MKRIAILPALLAAMCLAACHKTTDVDDVGDGGPDGDTVSDETSDGTDTSSGTGDGGSDGGNPCTAAAATRSSVGCSFLAVSTLNPELPAEFADDFAIVLGNTNAAEAEVTVSRAGSVFATATVPSGGTAVIALPMVAEVQDATGSVIVPDGAYEIASSVPVSAAQFNPLHYDLGVGEYSYSNDASLLLPEHALGKSYMASAWPTWGHGEWTGNAATDKWAYFYPGFVTVAATQDGTTVTITSSCRTAEGDPAPLSPGESTVVTLDRGDVLQVASVIPEGSTEFDYCAGEGWQQAETGTCPPVKPGEPCETYCSVTDGDITGTLIEAGKPVAVFAGHAMTFAPLDMWAGDRLEEAMLPLDSWADSAVMAAPMSPAGNGVEPALYRVLASEDGTALTFTPDVGVTATLGAGQFVEFSSGADFVVKGTHPIFVTQTLLGQTSFSDILGDPSMGSGTAMSGALDLYIFQTPDTFDSNYASFVAPVGAHVTLDGSPVTAFGPLSSTGLAVARVALDPGAHRVEGDVGVGLTLYGYANYASYLLPGGMRLE